MTDRWHQLLDFLRVPSGIKTIVSHYRFTFVAVLLVGLLVGFVGCQSTTKSPASGQSVTRDELDAEVTAMTARFKAAYLDLDRKDAPKLAGLELLRQVSVLVPAPWQPVAMIGLGAISTGLGIDGRRKDKHITRLKLPPVPTIKEG